MKTVMLVFGTRPEAIKMCPLVNELKTREGIRTVVCVTGQHRQMLDQVLDAFHVVPDYDLSIMKDKQTLFDITTNILNSIKGVLEEVKPDVVLVHGDTSTTFVTALACFYLQIPVGHVEAGLRTYNIYSPYPEEFNRQAVSILSRYNFAPTELSKNNLLREGREESTFYVTGNTAIDELKTTVREDYSQPELEWAKDSRLIMITAHRRENLGEPMHHMFRAIRRVMEEHPDVKAYVVDTLTAGPELALLVKKLEELIAEGLEFEEIKEKIDEYKNTTHLLFCLVSMRNFANNGRISHATAKMAGLLGIRAIGKASLEGTLEMVSKVRGGDKSVEEIVSQMKAHGYCGGRARIHHCQGEASALAVKERILSEFPEADVVISTTGALCSFYAEPGGFLVGYEGAKK